MKTEQQPENQQSNHKEAWEVPHLENIKVSETESGFVAPNTEGPICRPS